MPGESQPTRERIATLLTSYYKKCLDEDEKQELEAYCSQIPELRAVLQRLDDENAVRRDVDYFNESDPEIHLPVVLEKIRTPVEHNPSKTRALLWLKRAGAVAAVLLAVAGIYQALQPAAEKKALTVNSERKISSSGRHVILTLFDGQEISLDDAANGQIWKKDGITVMKTGAGNASYKTDTSAGDSQQRFNTLTVPYGNLFALTLPDGTKVWLNTKSTLTFPSAFHGGRRNVRLNGEAYLEVAQNDQQPFFLTVGPEGNEQTIEVLGTSFNITAYANEQHTETTLLSGKIRVVRENDTAVLTAGDQLISGQQREWLVQKAINTSNTVEWKEGRFNFTGNDIYQALRQLERWYDIQTEVRGWVSDRKFMTTAPHQPLGDLLDVLSRKGADFHYKFEGRKLIVSQ